MSASKKAHLGATRRAANRACDSTERERKMHQEQSQIIKSAIGRPTPNAPPIIIANAESKLGSACICRPDMPLLHRAPTGIARRPRMNDKH